MQELEGKCILIVDDDNRNTFALSSYLEYMGIQIRTAASGVEALEILRSSPGIELVLMDMMMPEMDGFETIHHIRNDQDLMRLPIIAVTASAMKGDREKCLNAGASEYVSKPVNLQELMDKMTDLLTND
jgi:CheY-like chemotaxis protein